MAYDRKQHALDSLRDKEPSLAILVEIGHQTVPEIQPILEDAQVLRLRILAELRQPGCNFDQVFDLLGQLAAKIHRAVDVALETLAAQTTDWGVLPF